jgi:hypothetical protein
MVNFTIGLTVAPIIYAFIYWLAMKLEVRWANLVFLYLAMIMLHQHKGYKEYYRGRSAKDARITPAQILTSELDRLRKENKELKAKWGGIK